MREPNDAATSKGGESYGKELRLTPRQPRNTPKRTTERGYGTKHQRLRSIFVNAVNSGQVLCSRCGQLIAPGEPWDLGHVDGDRSRYSGPEHRRCNRATAGRRRKSSRPW